MVIYMCISLSIKNIFRRKFTLKENSYINIIRTKMINIEKKPKKKNGLQIIQKKIINANEVILKENCQVNRLFCMADIHIKNNVTDHKIYYHVFENLFKELKKQNVNENDLIVIAGDIVDNGFGMSPHGILMLKFFYKKLAEFAPIINILGNHEYKLDVDMVTPILKDDFESKHKIYFLLDNKVYLYGNIAFVHTRFDSEVTTQCKKYNDNYTTVGLFHGIAINGKCDNGFVARSQFGMDDFVDCKYLVCGDLHTHQYLRKDHTAFYPGSLIQQKKNEPMIHGIELVEIEKGKCSFIEIQNDYKKMELEIDDNGDISNYDINELAKNTKYADINITYGKNNSKMMENIMKKFEENGITITDFKKKPTFGLLNVDTSVKIGKKTHKLSNIKTKDNFVDFFYNYVMSKHDVGDKDKFKTHLNMLITDSEIDNDLMTKKNVSITDIKINNLLIYGENTGLNIESINGILGVCQSNSFGKSSLCEMISLILFGKTPRCSNSKSFIRRGQSCGIGSVKMVINDTEYEVTRTIKLHGKVTKENIHADTTLELKKSVTNQLTHVYNSDKKIAENEGYEHVLLKELQLTINNLISYDEVYGMLIVSQERENSFLKNENKVDLLFKVSNLGYIDKISQQCSLDLITIKRNITSAIKNYIHDDFLVGFNAKAKDGDMGSKYIEHIEKKITQKEQEMLDNNVDTQYEKLFAQFEEQKMQKVKYEENLKNYIDVETFYGNDILALEERINLFIEEKIKNEAKIDELANVQNDVQKVIKQQQQNIKKFGDMELKHQEFENKKNALILQYKNQIQVLENDLVHCKYISDDEFNDSVNLKEKILIQHEQTNQKIKNIEMDMLTYSDPKKIFINYKLYIDIFTEQIACERFLDLCKMLQFNNVEISDELKETKKRNDKLKNDLIKYENYKIVYHNYDPDIDLIEERTKLCNEESNLNVQLKKINNIIENYELCKKNEIIQLEINKNNILIEEQRYLQFDKYKEYCDLIDKNKICQKKLDDIVTQIEKIKIKNDKLNNSIEKDEHLKSIIVNNIDKLKLYTQLKVDYEAFLKTFNKTKQNYEKIKREQDVATMKNKKIEDQIVIVKKIIEKSKEDVEKLNNYEIIDKSLKNNGLYDMLIEKIVKNLQDAVDQMTEFIGHEKINVVLTNKNSKYDVIINTKKIPDVSNAGGFQSKIMELLFKMAFLKINSYFKSDYIIIDEIYDACSEENKPMAIKLVEFFKMTYKKMLVVSHNPSIMELFDSRLTINYDEVNGNVLVQK